MAKSTECYKKELRLVSIRYNSKTAVLALKSAVHQLRPACSDRRSSALFRFRLWSSSLECYVVFIFTFFPSLLFPHLFPFLFAATFFFANANSPGVRWKCQSEGPKIVMQKMQENAKKADFFFCNLQAKKELRDKKRQFKVVQIFSTAPSAPVQAFLFKA